MIEIGMHDIHKNFGFQPVLHGVDLEIMTGDRAALVGQNGAGKTTLFKILAGEETADQGEVSLRRGATIGYLEQIPTLTDADVTVRQVLREPFAEAERVERHMRALEREMADDPPPDALQRLMDAYEQAQAAFLALDGYAMQENFSRNVTGFGLSALLDRPFRLLSGGQKTVVKLAATMLLQPDILLLDEPTNHLDVRTLEWFEERIAKYRGTVVIISHDRYFLDRVANKTILLEDGTCAVYHGNYSFCIQERERRLLEEFEQYKSQQKKIEAMRAAIQRFRDWGERGNNKKFFKKAIELERRLEKLELLERPELERPAIPMRFAGERSGREVLRLEGFGLTLGGAALFEQAELLVLEKQRVCLMGDNGAGKTSLLRAVLGEYGGYTGRLELNPSARLGYIPQEIRFASDSLTVLEAFRREAACADGAARGYLAQYFFCGDQVFKRISALSGGEKVLLKLAILLRNQVNLLVLDEPTNHIDIETRELLEQALLEYRGTLLFVSHDRYFIRKLADRIVSIQNRRLVSFDGDYAAFQQMRRQTGPAR